MSETWLIGWLSRRFRGWHSVIVMMKHFDNFESCRSTNQSFPNNILFPALYCRVSNYRRNNIGRDDRGKMTRKILIIETDFEMAELLSLHLKELNFQVHLANNYNSGLQQALQGRYDLIILDLMYPGRHGFELCRKLQGQDLHIPILLLTAKSSGMDGIIGLELGADDFVGKPFNIMEVIARVKAILRRMNTLKNNNRSGENAFLRVNGLCIDLPRRMVTLNGREKSLTPIEFDLLHHLASHPGQVFTRSQLLESVWGYNYNGYEHTVNSHINRLRLKIEKNPAMPKYLYTVWGVGYKFADQKGVRYAYTS
jgi:DNA-binding response OmpR family regulator